MDKSWMYRPRHSREYQEGVNQFLEFAFGNASVDGKITCPCKCCANFLWKKKENVEEHLICDGFLRGYTRWVFHGEENVQFSLSSDIPTSSSLHNLNVQEVSEVQDCIGANLRGLDNMEALIHDATGMVASKSGCDELGCPEFQDAFGPQYSDEEVCGQQEGAFEEKLGEGSFGRTSNFFELLKDAEKELFPGCKTFSKLSFIVHLFHIKCLGGWTEKSFSAVLELLGRAFSEDSSWPKSSYEAKKTIKALGLNYEKIHACQHDCMLFWGENANAESCHVCGSSRWVENKKKDQLDVNNDTSKTRKIPVKVLRYFPLIPRLQRFFILGKTANDMRWHEEKCKKDRILRHPVDGEAWKAFDARYPDFSSDPRNVRLALSSDGMNPFRTLNSTYSIWPLRNPNPVNDQVKYMFSSAGQPIGKIKNVVLDENSFIQAHRYVLRHCDEIQKFRQEFIDIEKRKRRRHAHLTVMDVEKLVNENFHVWFRSKVLERDDLDISEEIVALGVGPNKVAKRYSGFIINGFRFHTKAREENRITQNSGVVNTSEVGSVNYYGRLRDIIELDYYGSFKVILFKCDWVDVHHSRGIRVDEFGFTLVNFSHLIHTGEKQEDDPYVFSSQVEQVFYVQDPKNVNWSVVVKTKPRDLFDMGVDGDIN